MGLTNEQRSRFDELSAARKKRRRELAAERIKTEMRNVIRDFAKRYEFADDVAADRLREIRDGLLYWKPCGIDLEKLRDHDDWSFYGAYMLLMYEDFSGFVYIDDNGNMTEAFLR